MSPFWTLAEDHPWIFLGITAVLIFVDQVIDRKEADRGRRA